MEANKGIVNKWGCGYSLRILEEFFSETSGIEGSNLPYNLSPW
jgi:hypothetical protein